VSGELSGRTETLVDCGGGGARPKRYRAGAAFPRPTGRTAIGGGSSNPEHHRAIEQGIAHLAGLPYVRTMGDSASAISYLQILVPDRVGPEFEVPNHGSSRGFHMHRVSANRW
jgi:hypothetical protein